jgi:hippurate hydrolase
MVIPQDIHEAMIGWRHHLHAHPEIAFQEHATAAYLAEALRAMGLEPVCGLAGTGLVASLSRGHGPTIGLRADMDALPVTEATGVAYASTCPGVMHACGHDGHMATLLGAALGLTRQPDFQGTVRFIFQPAEENEVGGRRMVEEGFFDRFPCDTVYGMHNWPGERNGSIAVNPGPMMASMDLFEVRMVGRGCHAAIPESGTDPFLPAAQLVLGLLSLPARRISPLDSAVVSVTQVHGGETWNVIPDQVLVRGCVRSFDPAVQDTMEAAIRQLSAATAAAYGATAEVFYDRRYLPTINTAAEAGLAARAAATVVGAANVLTGVRPSMASEDFSYFLRERPGAYVWLGTAGTGGAPLHNAGFDYLDAALDTGCAYWTALVKLALPAEG